MIYLCPNCGHPLPHSLVDGIAFCGNCHHDLDTSQYNRIMSGAWMCIRQNPDTVDKIAKAVGLSEAESILVESFILTHQFSIEEFRAALKNLGLKYKCV
jgi:uncharacterized protein YlaI